MAQIAKHVTYKSAVRHGHKNPQNHNSLETEPECNGVARICFNPRQGSVATIKKKINVTSRLTYAGQSERIKKIALQLNHMYISAYKSIQFFRIY